MANCVVGGMSMGESGVMVTTEDQREKRGNREGKENTELKERKEGGT
jgi:hypothetical protein